jgi:hypothetical protein
MREINFMRAGIVVAVVGLALCSAAAYADSTAPENFTASGYTDATPGNIESTAFAKFDTSLGTLDSITIHLTGDADAAGDIGGGGSFLSGMGAGNEPDNVLIHGSGGTSSEGSFDISVNATFSSDLSYFEGTGTSTVDLIFSGSYIDISTKSTSGTITYNYTPTVVTPPAATPEPSSLALLGSGVLGVAGVVRRRMRR